MFNKYKVYIVPAVILLQFLWIILSVLVFEINLATGKTVILELVPFDPRSLMQGDYVILTYSISDIQFDYETVPDEVIRIVISPDERGVYDFKSIFRGHTYCDKDDVVVNGTLTGSRVFYGIEHYFVPEGTGADVEQEAEYALVKVSAWGDAMLVRLLSEEEFAQISS
jgi:uncharacterized membrane-anchored protein